MDEFKEYCYSLEEMAGMLGISVSTLKTRIYKRSFVPPFQRPTPGVYWFPRELFIAWLREQPVIEEVNSAS